MARTRITFQGHDGSTLAGLLEHPDGKADAYALFAHCFSCGKDIAAASRISRALVARGIAVFRFDFTGLGNSDGDFANTSFSSNVEDLRLAADTLREQYAAPELLIGHSLGGTAVLATASSIPECKAVVTIGAPAEPVHVLKQFQDSLEAIKREGKAEVDLGGRPFTISREFVEDVEGSAIENRISKLRRALLVMHSPLDNTVSINQAEKVYLAAKHPKSFISLDAADHLLTDKKEAEYVAVSIAAWSTRYTGREETRIRRETTVESGEIVVREHNHAFAREVTADQHRWLADEPTHYGGHELGPDPYEHLLASLGTCTSMTIRMYANRKKWSLNDVTVRISHERHHGEDCEGCDESEKKLEVISRHISLTGDLSDDQRSRLLEIADRCPVHKTLTGHLKITSELEN